MAKKFPDVKMLRIAKADREALDRVAGAIAGGNTSRAIRELIHRADESLRKAGIYERQAKEADCFSKMWNGEVKDDNGVWYKAMWGDSPPPKPAKGKSTDTDEEREAWDQKWGNKGPQAPATKRGGGGPAEASDYASRYGNEK